ncbi:WcbI family polysaccharide biosynthesis putative acetyltransferase [Lacisediminimonas profundi]|uniref:WcbI family polysaccharide biosynthesis putative acetyltransferase n=1 Tax=Lacisediminimonas profundi TaxID=2603856 RepID=UPI00124B432B|nr:WcbI family polysaccharide biosynthesis putative acetyltransferase [Lacisediminimonas profundi]
MKVAIIGNCQSAALQKIFRAASGNINVAPIKPVHMLSTTEIPSLYEEVSGSDLILCQPISPTYRGLGIGTESLKSIKKTNANFITIPNIHFDGFFPFLMYAKNKLGDHVTPKTPGYAVLPGDYHDSAVMAAAAIGRPQNEISDLMRSAELLRNSVSENWNKSLAAINEREAICDLKISPIIEKHGYEHQLFWTFNHPTNKMLDFVLAELFRLSGLDPISIKHHPEYLGEIKWSVAEGVKEVLGLQFHTNDYKYGKYSDYDLYMSELLSIYAERGADLIESNRNEYKFKLAYDLMAIK